VSCSANARKQECTYSLPARVEGTQQDSGEDPSLVQIWFRGGADDIVPRECAGIFTLGSYPRDPEQVRVLNKPADDIHRVTEGQTLKVSEVAKRLGPVCHIRRTFPAWQMYDEGARRLAPKLV